MLEQDGADLSGIDREMGLLIRWVDLVLSCELPGPSSRGLSEEARAARVDRLVSRRPRHRELRRHERSGPHACKANEAPTLGGVTATSASPSGVEPSCVCMARRVLFGEILLYTTSVPEKKKSSRNHSRS